MPASQHLHNPLKYPPFYTATPLYLLKSLSLHECRFPKLAYKKSYVWKKLNFVTKLPRSNPLVEYVVGTDWLKEASTVRGDRQFKMHIVRKYGADNH